MDITTIPCGRDTLAAVKEYRDSGNYPNYDAALSALLEEVDAEQ